MHLTRPKSSKGRSRPVVSDPLCSGDSIQGPPGSPVYSRPDRNLRSQSQPIMWQASPDEVVQMLQHAPAAPPQSLNKYKVLPSIGRRRQSEGRNLDQNMSKLSLSDDALLQQRHEEPDLPTEKDVSSEVDNRAGFRPKLPDPGPVRTKEGGSLLLAIRAPCGRRFQQSFEPTDSLLTVRVSAELRYGAQYGEASIETMDVPRRTFTDMEMTLAQCGIVTRSVLCISQRDSVVEHD